MQSRVVLKIDGEELRKNFKKIYDSVSPLGVIAVLKADAYGLGMDNIVRALSETNVSAIAVAEYAEAEAAMKFGLPVIILGTLLPSEIAPAVASKVRIPISDYEEAKAVSDEAVKVGVSALCHIALDTGMGRVGFRAKDGIGEILRVAKLPAIEIEGMFSHFPMAYSPTDEGTVEQISLFKKVSSELEQNGVNIKWKHIANSDAINNFPEACKAPFTHVRTGINLYGSFDIVGKRTLDLKPVLSVVARLAQIRKVSAGTTIGYGRTYTCPCDMLVGTVAAGYADGLPLAFSNRGALIIRDKLCPVLGRVCMDYVMVCLDQVPDAQVGDEVICLGESEKGLSISVEDWATLKGTHPYEVMCSIGSRVDRVLV